MCKTICVGVCWEVYCSILWCYIVVIVCVHVCMLVNMSMCMYVCCMHMAHECVHPGVQLKNNADHLLASFMPETESLHWKFPSLARMASREAFRILLPLSPIVGHIGSHASFHISTKDSNSGSQA